MKVLKWIGLGIGALLALLVVVAGVLYFVGGSKVDRTYDIQPVALQIPADSAALAHGAYVLSTNGCRDCHGEDLSGQVFVDAPPFRIVASNLTAGAGGIGDDYTATDWDRAIRHGVKPDGRPVFIMPSAAFHQLSDRDAAALIAYLQHEVPSVDHELPQTEIRAVGRIMSAVAFDPAMEVRTERAREAAPEPGPTAEYGAYLASVTCQYCHGADLRGGQPPEPGAPPAPDLAAAGQWPLDVFKQTLRTGVAPDGRELDRAMPISFTKHMTDTDLEALHAHLRTLAGPATQTAAQG